jgi:hypothetical protein
MIDQTPSRTALWHFTWPVNVAPIQANGFRDGEFGFVWFAPPSDTYWQLSGKVLLEVTLDVNEADLDPYRSSSEDTAGSYEWSAEEGRWKESPRIYRQVLYKIPADFFNTHCTGIRLVPQDEYRPKTGGVVASSAQTA